MWKLVRPIVAVLLIGCLLTLGCGFASAETNSAQQQSQDLLEKGLTLYELDREIARLGVKEQDIAKQISEVQLNLNQLSERMKEQSDRVKLLLQATYTGDRVPLWMMVLSARTWKDALYVFDQLKLIAERDRTTLDRYTAAHREKSQLNTNLEQAQTELRSTRTRFEDQRKQMLTLQDEVSRKLAALPQKDDVVKQMSQLNANWETKGLPLFKQYFAALAETMQKLPELIAQNPNSLTIKGLTYTFQIRDSELNAFIHTRNPALQQLNFSFGEGSITASGTQGDTSLSLSGAYELEMKPKNAIRFHIRDITYNGFKLPSSTIQALESGNDLSFYPSKLASFLQATELKVKDHAMSVTLKMSF